MKQFIIFLRVTVYLCFLLVAGKVIYTTDSMQEKGQTIMLMCIAYLAFSGVRND
jgi:hypothetical protein